MTQSTPIPSPAEPVAAYAPAVLTADAAAEISAARNAKILILDDEPYNVMVVRKYLRDEGYTNLLTSTDAPAALQAMTREAPGLLLLDIVMPQINGLEILRRLRAEAATRHLPVLILTAATDAATKRAALDLGATDFLHKPVDPNDLLPRVRNALVAKSYHDRLTNQAADLAREVRKRTAELAASREEVVRCLARAAEYRDDNTGHHVTRVGRYAGLLARQLGFREEDVENLELAAQLHDVGKIGVPDAILNNPGKLDPELFAVMQRHCAIGNSILTTRSEEEWRQLRRHAEMGAGLLEISSSPLLMLAARIAQSHHEWYDGSGYPLGLAGEDIPIEGRITAVADVFDALSSSRPYKKPINRERCFAMMEADRGTHFDPRVLDAFLACRDEIVRIQLEYMDRG